MHIGLLIYGALETVSGGYLYDRKLVEYLRKCGDTVEIISIPWRNYPAHLTDNFNPAFYRRLRKFDGDVLLQDELNHPSLCLLNRYLINQVQYPIISIVHHLRINEQHPAWLMPLYRAVEGAYLRTLSGFVFNSQTTKQSVERWLGRSVASVVAHPAGDRLPVEMREEDIRQRSHAPGALRLLFVGNVIPRKGLHTVFAALKMVDFAWEMWVAGDLRVARKYVEGLRPLVKQRGWERQVHFLDVVDDEALMKLTKACQVFVMPSSYEGFGIAYLEAMGFGLPAIGTTAGAAGELIQHGRNGFLIPPEDARALAQCLTRLEADRTLLAEMSLAAKHTFLTHPGWDASMGRVRDFLSRLLERFRVV